MGKEEDLVNAREAVDEFKEKISTEVRRQEGVEKWNSRMKKDKQIELLGDIQQSCYMVGTMENLRRSI